MVTKKEIELVSDDELESEPEPTPAPAKIQPKVNFFFLLNLSLKTFCSIVKCKKIKNGRKEKNNFGRYYNCEVWK